MYNPLFTSLFIVNNSNCIQDVFTKKRYYITKTLKGNHLSWITLKYAINDYYNIISTLRKYPIIELINRNGYYDLNLKPINCDEITKKCLTLNEIEELLFEYNLDLNYYFLDYTFKIEL